MRIDWYAISGTVLAMSLSVDTRLPAGNATAVRIAENESSAEIRFAADPCGGSEALWFHFRVVESSPDTPHPEHVTLTLMFVRNMTGCNHPATLRPVFRGSGQSWNRTRSGKTAVDPDGQTCVSWTIPYPSPSCEIALCYPYGAGERKALVRNSKNYWTMNAIGLAHDAHPIERLSNTVHHAKESPGIFLIARQHAGETPGSWVLDGILQHFSRSHESRILVWAVPLADVAGIERGHYGRDSREYDLDQAWGTPPLRYETRAIQNDLAEWASRCHPSLVLDLQATGGTDAGGIFCRLPGNEDESAAARDAEKWANVFRESLGDDFAADDFKQHLEPPTGGAGLSLAHYARESLSVGALSLATPYTLCRKTLLTPTQYREAGRRIARAAVRRILTR